MLPEVRSIQLEHTLLHYVEVGSGFPLILVHGSLGDYRTWGLQLEAFSAHYRVIAYSRRYHYPNPWNGDGLDYSADLHAGDLLELTRALGLREYFLVGNSFGAYTSLVAALRQPTAVRKLVLGEPPILPWLERTPEGRQLFDQFMNTAWQPGREAFQRGDMEGGVATFVNAVSGAPVFNSLPESARQSMLENAPSLKAETLSRQYFTEVTCEDLRGFDRPTLLLTGERSPRMFALVVDELERCLPNVRRAMIPGASHSMPSGNPAAYNETVLDFLAS